MADVNQQLAARARAVIDANNYMTLGTSGLDGRPWVTPVYFTADGYTDFYWTSSPASTHSRNLAERPELSIVIFDSQARIGGAEAVFVRGRAEQVVESELARSIELLAEHASELAKFTVEEFCAPAALRLYRATAAEHSVLIRGGDPVFGREVDSRMTVDLSD